jgi:hypothetical protein
MVMSKILKDCNFGKQVGFFGWDLVENELSGLIPVKQAKWVTALKRQKLRFLNIKKHLFSCFVYSPMPR